MDLVFYGCQWFIFYRKKISKSLNYLIMPFDPFENIWNKFFIDSTRANNVQIFRYLTAGLFAFIVDASFLFILTEYLHLYYLLSALLAYSIGLLISYTANIVWVFDSRKQKRRSVEMLIFITITLIGLLITFALMWFLTSELNIYYLISKVITTIIVFGWNFLLKKWILFC